MRDTRHDKKRPAANKNAGRVYIGNAVYTALFAWFFFRPFQVGIRLFAGLSGKAASGGEIFVGILIWACVILMLLLTEVAIFYTFRFCKPRKSSFAAWGAAAFFVVTLLRTVYAILQSWA